MLPETFTIFHIRLNKFGVKIKKSMAKSVNIFMNSFLFILQLKLLKITECYEFRLHVGNWPTVEYRFVQYNFL